MTPPSLSTRIAILQIRLLFILMPALHRLRLVRFAPWAIARLPAALAVLLLFLLFQRLGTLLPAVRAF
jgi:hypothetical protein